MDGLEFVNKLKAENEAILTKIDEPQISSGIPKGELLATIVHWRARHPRLLISS